MAGNQTHVADLLIIRENGLYNKEVSTWDNLEPQIPVSVSNEAAIDQRHCNQASLWDLGKEFQEIKEVMSGLQKSELFIKNPTSVTLGMGMKFNKTTIKHFIQ